MAKNNFNTIGQGMPEFMPVETAVTMSEKQEAPQGVYQGAQGFSSSARLIAQEVL